MPNVSVTSGAVLIQGSRSTLPQQANEFSPVRPLIVDIGSGSIFIIGGSVGVFAIATLPVDITISSVSLTVSSVTLYNSSVGIYPVATIPVSLISSSVTLTVSSVSVYNSSIGAYGSVGIYPVATVPVSLVNSSIALTVSSVSLYNSSVGVYPNATIPVTIIASSVDLTVGSVSIYNSSIATYYAPAVTTILNNATVSAIGSILVNTSDLQSLNMEIAFIAAGSIEFSFTGYQTIASIATSTILTTGWLSSTVLSGVTMSSPSANTALGQNVMVVWNSTLATSVSAILTQTK